MKEIQLPLKRTILKAVTLSACLFATMPICATEPLSSQTVPQPRLVVLSPHAVEMLYEIGAGDNIIGTVDYADYPAAANNIRRIGRHDFIDYEALMLLQPDAIIVSSTTTEAMKSRLDELGFTLVDASVKQLMQIPQRLTELGELTHHQAQAQQSASEFSRQLVALKQTYQAKSPVNLFYQIWPTPLTTTASPWMNEIFRGCGANNVFANSVSEYPQVSLEQVLYKTPQVIIKPVYHGNGDQEAVNWNKWPEIPAVANDLIVTIEGDLVHRTGPRVLQGMQLICEIVDRVRSQTNAPTSEGSQ